MRDSRIPAEEYRGEAGGIAWKHWAVNIRSASGKDALAKRGALPLLAGRNIVREVVVPAIATSVGLLVHCQRVEGGRLHVQEIIAPMKRVIDGAPAMRVLPDGGAMVAEAQT